MYYSAALYTLVSHTVFANRRHSHLIGASSLMFLYAARREHWRSATIHHKIMYTAPDPPEGNWIPKVSDRVPSAPNWGKTP